MNHESPKPQDDDFDTPIAGLRDLRVDVEPGRDLWAGIEARIAPRPARKRVSSNAWMSMAAAASVAVVIGLGVLRPMPPGEIAVPATQGTFSLAPAPNLEAAPGSRALVKANLQMSRNSEAQIRKAMEQDPDSASLRRLLNSAEARSDELRRLLATQST